MNLFKEKKKARLAGRRILLAEDVEINAAILMDVRMPTMDGLEATKVIRSMDRADAKRIPIIALIANSFDEDVQLSLQAGMYAHLSKPVEIDTLIRILGELVYESEQLL